MHIYAYAKLYIYEEIFAWKSPNNARNLLKKLDFDFAISLCILEAVLTETKPLSQQLQSAQTDMLEYSTQIKQRKMLLKCELMTKVSKNVSNLPQKFRVP